MLFVGLLHSPITALGPGERIGVWLQGCSKRCAGCIAPNFQPFNASTSMSLDALLRRIRMICSTNKKICGITFSGGEPLEQKASLFELLNALRKEFSLDILIYSGLTFDEISSHHTEILSVASALVSGPFVLGEESNDPWKGSSNQRLTVLDIRFRARYAHWIEQSRRKLQLVKTDNGVQYLIGIPEQQHAAILKQQFTV